MTIETRDVVIDGREVGGCRIERYAAGRVVVAAFWGVMALVAAEARAVAERAASEALAVETVDVEG